MEGGLSLVVLGAYSVASIGLMFYGCHCYVMTFMFLRRAAEAWSARVP